MLEWLREKVTQLHEAGRLKQWFFIPEHSLFVVARCDSDQGSTKFGLRLLNVDNPRSQHSLDPMVLFPAPKSYEILKHT